MVSAPFSNGKFSGDRRTWTVQRPDGEASWDGLATDVMVEGQRELDDVWSRVRRCLGRGRVLLIWLDPDPEGGTALLERTPYRLPNAIYQSARSFDTAGGQKTDLFREHGSDVLVQLLEQEDASVEDAVAGAGAAEEPVVHLAEGDVLEAEDAGGVVVRDEDAGHVPDPRLELVLEEGRADHVKVLLLEGSAAAGDRLQ